MYYKHYFIQVIISYGTYIYFIYHRAQCSHRFPSGDALIQHYSFNETDLALISQHRGSENRLGFAMQLCYMRYPGIIHQ
nr:DUF4158 domain-containing protein [Bathymodiolus platifrons methanotrophic gill symbiont]